MNKHFRVITINGFRGIFAAVLIIAGLISGFVVTPGFLAMKFWNHYISSDFNLPVMNIFQGILLWLIVFVCLYLLNNKQPLIGFGSYSGLSPEQLKEVVKKARACELTPADIKVKSETSGSDTINAECNINNIGNDKTDEETKQ